MAKQKGNNINEKKGKPTRTEISQIGRVAMLNYLFKETGFQNSDFQKIGGNANSPAGSVGVVNKVLLEGVDFDLTYTPIKYLGYRAVVNSIGELYAHLYTPCSLSFTIAVSSKFSFEHIRSLWEGVLKSADVYEIKNLSLDITSSLTGLTISVSASGVRDKELEEKIKAPKSGDLLCVTGDLGAAYMGLHVLMREKVAFNASKEYKQPDLSSYKYLLSRYLAPEADSESIVKFSAAKIYPSEGKFITRGLGDAVKTLCARYGLGARVYIDKIPIASQTSAMAKEIDIDIVTAVINGGDDNRLLFVVPLEEHEKLTKTYRELEVIGHFTKDPETLLVTPEGNTVSITAQGWSEQE